MIEGRFGNTSGRPYVEGRVYFPRFDLSGDISFLVDTGADASLLNPSDVMRMGVDLDLLEGAAESVGLGGAIQCFVEPAWVIFTADDGTAYIYEVGLEIAPAQPDTLDLPSLLGREILDRWRMVYDPTVGELEFEVRSADLTIPPESSDGTSEP